jgi:hypothetical protein
MAQKWLARALGAPLVFACVVPQAWAGQDFALKGFTMPVDKPVTVVFMRPDVDVGEMQAGGLAQPNADWTQQARSQVEKAVRAELAQHSIAFSSMEEAIVTTHRREVDAATACDKAAALAAAAATPAISAGAPAAAISPATACASPTAASPEDAVAQYAALHKAIVASILEHQYNLGGGKLPTKKDAFAYTMGPGAAQLGAMSGANYGLFIMTNDEFASASRKTMQVAGLLGCMVGFCVIVRGGVHDSYASLVELSTGNIVWFNLQRGSKGDVRQEAGARDMARAILASMPRAPAGPAGATIPRTASAG